MEKLKNTLKNGLFNGLKVYNKKWIPQTKRLVGVFSEYDGTVKLSVSSQGLYNGIPMKEATPHLYDLSDLVNPIRVEGYNDGKEFVPAKELFNGMENLQLTTFEHKVFNLWATYTILDEVFSEPIIGVEGIKDADYWIVNKLQSWHFNTEGLPPDQFINAKESKVYEPKTK